MELHCWRDERAFDVLAEEWEALHKQSQTATLFNSLLYGRLWWRHFGVPGRLQIWTARERGRLVGIIPLYETTDETGEPVLRLLGGLDVSDYLDIVSAPGREEEVIAAFLAAWADAPCHCALDFHAVRYASPSREAFLRQVPALPVEMMEEQEEICPVITLPESWEAYMEQLDGKQRRELRRKLRKAGQEALVSWYRVSPELLREEMEHFFHLHALSAPEKAAFMTPEMRAFFLDLAFAFQARGWLELSFLLLDGSPAATYMNFIFRNEVLVYNSGFDSRLDGSLSPGWLLLCYLIEEAIAAGRSRYDFLRGDEAYKFRFGARSEPIYHLRLTHVTSRQDVPDGRPIC